MKQFSQACMKRNVFLSIMGDLKNSVTFTLNVHRFGSMRKQNIDFSQFFIKGFSAPYRQDRNRTGGGLLLFVREDVPSRILNPKSKTDIDSFR